MAYVPEVKYDLFVSYAHVDDEAATGVEGWVSRFVGDLTRAVRSRLGLATNEELKIFFDRRSLRSNDDLEALRASARSSAVFIAIVSPSYIARDWTIEELRAFAEARDATSRIFAIESLPADDPGAYPDPIRGRIRSAFWVHTEHSDTEYRLSPDDRRWDGKIQDVAKDIKTVLRGMRSKDSPGKAPVGPPSKPKDLSRTVLLGQVTDDLDEEHNQVRRHLEQFGILVLPEATYPQGGEPFAQAFEADLVRAGFFVQLLGPSRSRHPPDLLQGYSRYQYEAAKQEAAKRENLVSLLWRRPDLDPATVTHDEAPLLSAPETLAMGLEAFKAEIVRRVEQANTPKKAPPVRASDGDIHVFINADRDDLQLAKALQEDLKQNGCTAFLPVYDGQPRDIMADLEEKIVWCDALALIYGEADARWVSRQAMLYSKLKRKREKPARVVLICRAPPKPKPEHGVAMPELREIDYDSSALGSPLKDILSELRQ